MTLSLFAAHTEQRVFISVPGHRPRLCAISLTKASVTTHLWCHTTSHRRGSTVVTGRMVVSAWPAVRAVRDNLAARSAARTATSRLLVASVQVDLPPPVRQSSAAVAVADGAVRVATSVMTVFMAAMVGPVAQAAI